MHPFMLERPRDLAAAIALRAQAGHNLAPAEYIAGGTDMVQLLQENVRRPERLVSLAGLLDSRIEAGPKGLRIGAAATMADVAAHPAVVQQFSVIAQSLLESASPQVRNQATMARQSHAASALPVLSRCRLRGMQPALAGHRMLGNGRREPLARGARHAGNASPRTHPTLRSRSLRSTHPSSCRAWRPAHGAARRLLPPAR